MSLANCGIIFATYFLVGGLAYVVHHFRWFFSSVCFEQSLSHGQVILAVGHLAIHILERVTHHSHKFEQYSYYGRIQIPGSSHLAVGWSDQSNGSTHIAGFHMKKIFLLLIGLSIFLRGSKSPRETYSVKIRDEFEIST